MSEVRARAFCKFVILGEPASKANSRQLVFIKGRPAFIKSAKALQYTKDALKQVRKLPELMQGELKATIKIYYASQRPDLDESIVLDVLQGLIYQNDRQVRERHVYHFIDKLNPRAEVEIEQRETLQG